MICLTKRHCSTELFSRRIWEAAQESSTGQKSLERGSKCEDCLFPRGGSKDEHISERKGDGKSPIHLPDDEQPEHIGLYLPTVEPEKENQINAMAERVTTRAWEKKGAFQSVFDADSGEVEEHAVASKREDVPVYVELSASTES